MYFDFNIHQVGNIVDDSLDDTQNLAQERNIFSLEIFFI